MDLERYITEFLAAAGQPLTSREIARQLSRILGHPVDTSEVNSELYGKMSPCVTNGEDYRWSLKTKLPVRSSLPTPVKPPDHESGDNSGENAKFGEITSYDELMITEILSLFRQIQSLSRTCDLLLPRLLSGQLELKTN
jgi:hypothetical protein|uniref:hypothetical protein n=1 Tax=Cephaloticoccus sp. TaxID=1985742 RepID=UPI00404AB974